MGEDLWDIERKKAAIQVYLLYNIIQMWRQNTFFSLQTRVESISAAITWKNLKEANEEEQNDTRWRSESKQRMNKH